MRRLIRSRLISIYTVYKGVSEFTWCPNLPDFTLYISLPAPYSYTYVGGALAVKEATFMNMNGFSNLYFGWGSEDDDSGIR